MPQVSDIWRGANAFLKGLGWLRQNKRYFLLLCLPAFLGVSSLFLGWSLFTSFHDDILSLVLFDKPDGYFMLALYYVSVGLLYLASIAVVFLASLLLINIIASPIYEIVSQAVEQDVTGKKVSELGLWDSVKLIKEECKKTFFILTISLILLFIPGINILALFVTAFLLGWELYDYPMARRGMSFRQRLTTVSHDFVAVTIFGFWLMIPVMQLFILPFAVPGGTLLNLEKMDKRHLSG